MFLEKSDDRFFIYGLNMNIEHLNVFRCSSRFIKAAYLHTIL